LKSNKNLENRSIKFPCPRRASGRRRAVNHWVSSPAANTLPKRLATFYPCRSSGSGALRRAPPPHCARPQTLAWCLGFALMGSRNVSGSSPLAAIQIAKGRMFWAPGPPAVGRKMIVSLGYFDQQKGKLCLLKNRKQAVLGKT